MTATSSLQDSLSFFMKDTMGLGADGVYIQGDVEYTDFRVLRQFRSSKSRQREISGDSMSDNNIFLIELSVEPKRNDKLQYKGKTYYVDDWDEVTDNSYRIVCAANQEIVPSPTNRIVL